MLEFLFKLAIPAFFFEDEMLFGNILERTIVALGSSSVALCYGFASMHLARTTDGSLWLTLVTGALMGLNAPVAATTFLSTVAEVGDKILSK